MTDTATTTKASERSHEYPAAAFYLDCGAFEFGQPQQEGGPIPLKMVIRSKQGVERFGQRWFHDFAGMRRKERVPVDYRHDPDRLIGYLDNFQTKADGMHASGLLVPYGEEDIGHEIAYRAQNGVPYEASIYFGGNGLVVEELSANAKAKVNGQTIQGPAVIFRQWPLRGVAITPYAADDGTSTRFSEKGTVRLTVLNPDKEHTEMSDSATIENLEQEDVGLLKRLGRLLGLAAKAEATEPPANGKKPEALSESAGPAAEKPQPGNQETPPDAEAIREQLRAEQKRFVDAFGPEGAVAFAEGKSFDEAALAHIEALNKKVDGLATKLKAIDRGEDNPADFNADDEDAEGTQRRRHFTQKLGRNLGRFAAGIKLPER